MFGSLVSGALGAVGSKLAGGLFGGGDAPELSPEELRDNEFSKSGIASSLGSSVPPPLAAPAVSGEQSEEFGMDMLKKGISSAVDGVAGSIGDAATQRLIQRRFGKDAGELGRDARSFMDNAYPELNPWEKAGASGSAGAAGEVTAKRNAIDPSLQAQLKNQKDIAKIQSDTALKTAGIQSATALTNTREQVHAQNQMLDLNKSKALAEITKLYSDKSLVDETTLNRIAERANIKLNGEQLKSLTHKVNQDIRNERYGKGYLGQTISGGTDAAFDVRDRFLSHLDDIGLKGFSSFLRSGGTDATRSIMDWAKGISLPSSKGG